MQDYLVNAEDLLHLVFSLSLSLALPRLFRFLLSFHSRPFDFSFGAHLSSFILILFQLVERHRREDWEMNKGHLEAQDDVRA